MPTLRKSPSGGYYIRGKVPGIGAFSTWQVRPQGLELLTRMRIEVDKEVPIGVFRELHRRGLLYTHQSGILVHQREDESLPLKRKPCLDLRIEETPLGLDLVAWFPEVPSEYVTGVDVGELIDQVSRCAIAVDQGRQVPAIGLLPGQGGVVYPVSPKESRYVASMIGHWPPSFMIESWVTDTPGVRRTGTVFAGPDQGGARLMTGDPIIVNHSYYLLGEANSALLPPDPVQTVIVDSNGPWRIWEFALPEDHSKGIRAWCEHMGHPVQQEAWRVGLLAPAPESFTMDGFPTVPTGVPVLLGIVIPDQGHFHQSTTLSVEHNQNRETMLLPPAQDARRALYVQLCFRDDGLYRIFGSSINPITIRAASSPARSFGDMTSPRPLRVSIRSGGCSRVLDAFRDGTGPHEFTWEPGNPESRPEIRIDCPFDIGVWWSSGPSRSTVSRLSPDKAPQLLATAMDSVEHSGGLLALHVEAGAFGSMVLQFSPVSIPTVTRSHEIGHELTSRQRARARWLEALDKAIIPRPIRAVRRAQSSVVACQAHPLVWRTSLHRLALARAVAGKRGTG